MSLITENVIEKFCIELLEKQGYQYIHAPDIAPDGERPERSSYEDVLLNPRLIDAIARINPTIPHEAQQQAIKEIGRIHLPELSDHQLSWWFIRLRPQRALITARP